MLKIPYCISNFKRIRSDNFLYVDKTHFIEKLETVDYILHLRPRRFGKSLFLDMLDNYYDIASRDQFDELFGGLYIHNNPTAYRNSYYILRLDFSGIENDEKEGLKKGFLRRVKIGAERFISRYELDIHLDNLETPASVLDSLFKGFAGLKRSIKSTL